MVPSGKQALRASQMVGIPGYSASTSVRMNRLEEVEEDEAEEEGGLLQDATASDDSVALLLRRRGGGVRR